MSFSDQGPIWGRRIPEMPLSPAVTETQRYASPQTSMARASVIIRK